jgi:hypothetical protein
MKLYKIPALVYCLFCLSCAIQNESGKFTESVPTPPLEYGSDAVIKKKYMESGGLYSRYFELTVKGDGQVTLDGNINDPKPIRAEWSVPRENFSRLVEAFEESNFYALKEESGQILVDGSVMTISIFVDGKEKQVKRHFDFENSAEQQTMIRLKTIINKEAAAEPYIRKCCYFPSNYPSESIP